jgi:hypothetical protein
MFMSTLPAAKTSLFGKTTIGQAVTSRLRDFMVVALIKEVGNRLYVLVILLTIATINTSTIHPSAQTVTPLSPQTTTNSV